MTTGEKLSKLRKNAGYTQEELADALGVSRQSVSKWEQDLAYPETDKLIKIGKLFDCSMDYLLKDETKEKSEGIFLDGQADKFEKMFDWHYEVKSKKEYNGIPLVHINVGIGRTARGIFAIGNKAVGVVSIGLLSMGILSFGVLSLGLLTFGVLALGTLAFGAVSVGIIAFGAVAFGILSVGAMAIGDFSVGALAIGKYYALGDHAYGMVAIGKTYTEGSLCYSSLKLANSDAVRALLDNGVPEILNLFKRIVTGLK